MCYNLVKEMIESITSMLEGLIEFHNSDILTYESEIKEYNNLSLESDDPMISEVIKWMIIRTSAANAKIDKDSNLLNIFENKWSKEKLLELKELLPERINFSKCDLEYMNSMKNHRDTHYDMGKYFEIWGGKIKLELDIFKQIENILDVDLTSLDPTISSEQLISTPLDIIKIRLAKGEITLDEYDVLKSRLEGTSLN